MPENTMVPRRRVLVAPLALLMTFAFGAVAHAASPPPKITKVQPLKLEIGQKLTVTGKHFVPGKSKNILVFKRDGKPAVFVKVTDAASSTKLTLVLPPKLMDFLKEGDKLGTYRFRLRVLGKRFGDAFTPTKLSPQIAPPGADAPGAVPTGTDDCDGDKIVNSAETDDDNDLLSDETEAGLKTNPCKFDSDGDGVSDAFEVESALDLNARALPYPGKRPFPNALDGTDAIVDYDGDGLAMVEEYTLWLYTAKGNLPLTYSDGDQDTNVASATTPSTDPGLDSDHDGLLTDDEKDADGDSLGNFDESHGRLKGGWWGSAIKTEKPFFGRAGVQVMTELSYVDPDVDGDGLADGFDDQDHDGWTNVQERSRSALPAITHPAYAGYTGILPITNLYVAVNPYNPCLPDRASRVCTLHPPFDDAWAPFDGSSDLFFVAPYWLSNTTGSS